MNSYKSYQETVIESTIAIIDTKMKKLDYEFNKLLMEHEKNLNLIELKVLTEHGTYDDLELLYMKEAEETNKNSKGIISRIIDVIIGFFRKLRTFIFGEKKDDNENKQPTIEDIPDDAKITVEEDPAETEKQTVSALSAIRSFLAGNKKPLEEFAGGKTKVNLATGAVVITGVVLKRMMKKFEKLSKQAENELQDAKKKSEKMNSDDQSTLKKGLDFLNRCVKKMTNVAKSGISKVRTGESDPNSRAAQIKMRIKQLEKLGEKRTSDGDSELRSLRNELEQIEKSRQKNKSNNNNENNDNNSDNKSNNNDNKSNNDNNDNKSNNDNNDNKDNVDYSMFRNSEDVQNEKKLIEMFKKHMKTPNKINCLFCFRSKSEDKSPHVWKLDKHNRKQLDKTIESIKRSLTYYEYLGTIEYKNGKWEKTTYKPF